VKNPHISKNGQPIDTKFSALLRTINEALWVVYQHRYPHNMVPAPWWILNANIGVNGYLSTKRDEIIKDSQYAKMTYMIRLQIGSRIPIWRPLVFRNRK